MERTITIKGVARTTVKPDYIIITMSITGEEKKYQDAVASADAKIKSLSDQLIAVGFDKEGIKTTHFSVNPQYKVYTDRKNKIQREFTGYRCSHDLNIEFDYDSSMLGKALGTITSSTSNPQLNISFTLKDKEAVGDSLLEMATQNAKKRAEIMCAAAGSKLGNLVSVDYSWNDVNFFSRPGINMNDTCELALPTAAVLQSDIQPNDIKISDSATFVWEIE